MKTFEVVLERSAYRVLSLKVEAESEAAAEELALKAVDQLEGLPDGVEVESDQLYDDSESVWEVNETNEVEYR